MARINIMGCNFDCWDLQQTLYNIENLINLDDQGYLCTVNVSILMIMRGNPRLANIILNSKMVVADGQPIIWVSRYMNKPLPERVTGVELVDHLAQLSAKNKWGIYLLGATKEVIAKVKDSLLSSHPELIISGNNDGYFDSNSADILSGKIRSSGAKILIVAMGVPRQEYFIEEYLKRTGVNFAIGVGGSFDVIAGITRRAPIWMQKSGLEWLFRALQEPGRLMGRYVRTNTLFIYLFIKDILLASATGKNNKQ